MSERLDARSIWQGIFAQFNLERGLIKTFVDLTKRPGQMLLTYLDGTRRKKYVNVIAYWVLSVTLSVGVISFNDYQSVIPDETRAELLAMFDGDSAKLDEYLSVLDIFTKNIQSIAYILLPIISLITLWIFRFWNLTYVEHLIVNAYAAAHAQILTVPVYAVGVLFDPVTFSVISSVIMTSTMFIFAIYVSWAFTQICRQSRPNLQYRNAVRSVVAVVIQSIIVLILAGGFLFVLSVWKASQLLIE